jgi:hypothetical protein
MMEMKKILVVGIILLFIGVAVAPNINLTVVKASTDDDFVEIATQVCGIKGYKDTTITLTKEQYQDLEQYLGEFRARLNQTSTREEAIPIFKEAVVELDKYGLLPKGISVQHAQKLVIGPSYPLISKNLMKRVPKNTAVNGVLNFFCLVIGNTNQTYSLNIFGILPFYFLGRSINILPFRLFGPVIFGKTLYDFDGKIADHFSQGWIAAVGLNGLTQNSGSCPFKGALYSFDGLSLLNFFRYHVGMIFFSGITLKNGGSTFLLGFTPCLALKEYSP